MASFFTTVDSAASDDELHSAAADAVELESTPAYDDALNRMVKLGLSREEAQQVLKG